MFATRIPSLLVHAVLLTWLPIGVNCFGGITTDPAFINEVANFPNTIALFVASSSSSTSSSLSVASAVGVASDLLQGYKECLHNNPLATKMITGGSLAVMGDAIAQSRLKNEPYDKRRALSFATFDMCYRAVQHAAFPIIVANCHGQFLQPCFGPLVQAVTHQNPTPFLAAMEQTLASQLGIVPFLYYPVFYTLTGLVQGLDQEQTIQRAKETFVPLMKRNLMFWIPVQFVQFGFIEENLQIPFLSACGLAWTFILSVMAGSTKHYSSEKESVSESTAAVLHKDPNIHYAVTVTGTDTEPASKINTDHLFPGLACLEEDVDMLGKATTGSLTCITRDISTELKLVEEKKKEKNLIVR